MGIHLQKKERESAFASLPMGADTHFVYRGFIKSEAKLLRFFYNS